MNKEQLEIRKNGIGGSDMPIILGLSRYKTPYELYLEKTGVLEEKEKEDDRFQYWGKKLEPLIIKEFEERNQVTVTLKSENILHPIHDFLRGTLDGFIKEWNSVLESKTCIQFLSREWGEEGSDVIPLQYLVQVAHYCCIKNADSANIAVLIGGNDYREFKYIRDYDIENNLIEAAKTFWECVKTNSPPPPINQEDLKLMFPSNIYGKTIESDQEIEEILGDLTHHNSKIKELTKITEDCKFKIMKFMEDAECLINKDGRPLVTWKSNKNGRRTFLLKEI